MILKLLAKFGLVKLIILTDCNGKERLSIKIKDNFGYHCFLYPIIFYGFIRLAENGDCYVANGRFMWLRSTFFYDIFKTHGMYGFMLTKPHTWEDYDFKTFNKI